MTDYRIPGFVTQRTGSACQFSLCWAAIGAWLARAATNDTVQLTPEEFARKAGGGSGRPNPTTGCKTGFERDLQKGLTNLGIDSDLFTIPFADFTDRMKPERRAVFAVAVDYELWPPDQDCMNGTVGPAVDHMVGIIPGVDGKGRVQTENPLCTDYQRVSLGAISTAARKFGRDRGRSGVMVVRVLRPMPSSLPTDKERIARLEDLVERQADYIAASRTLAQQSLELEVPR